MKEYNFIPTARGKQLLMVNGFTYSQYRETGNFYCSKKDVGCRAKVKLCSDGRITVGNTHTHEPPKYAVVSGRYVKL